MLGKTVDWKFHHQIARLDDCHDLRASKEL
jgi:hypothetical protein